MVQPAYWFNFSLDKRGTINQESLYLKHCKTKSPRFGAQIDAYPRDIQMNIGDILSLVH